MFACTGIYADIFFINLHWVITQENYNIFYAENEAMVNNFLGLFIVFLPRLVLFRVTTAYSLPAWQVS